MSTEQIIFYERPDRQRWLAKVTNVLGDTFYTVTVVWRDGGILCDNAYYDYADALDVFNSFA